ncbi:wax ester/triacylglycerol synthase family O-acyltransferase [Nocardia vinacea]|uniref:Diacylglycerol O-acyltransferase n=1 Tax=Nocardia vinacea TaxID=96468 RepID=A0ABZ1YRH6_9NOCA|nr:wax ester/triacylglycerol synthase family O-acyltransferase [Nocardia vinacea]
MSHADLKPARHLDVRIMTPGQLASGTPAEPAKPSQRIPLSGENGPSRQLSSLDVLLLNAESPTMLLHVGSVTLLEPPTAGSALDVTVLRRLIASRLHLTAPLRWRLRTVPFGLDLPYWEDSDTIDLGYHVRDTRLPEDSTDQALAELAARLHAQPLDRSRPLWECHLISGLAEGRQAIYTKVHHALIDGVSGAEVMAALFDIVPESQPVPPPPDGLRLARTPKPAEIVGRGIAHTVTRQADRVRLPMRLGPMLPNALADMPKVTSTLPGNGPNGTDRSFAFVSLPLDTVKQVKNSFGGTVNDVVMTLCTTAFRRWLLDHDAPADDPAVAAIPVSVRTQEQLGTAGNQFSIMLCELPIGEPDPQHRMKLTHAAMLAAKDRFQTTPPALLHYATAALPQILHGLATRLLLRVAAPALPLANMIVSNVPGPQMPLYAGGIQVAGTYPISVLTDLSGPLNITVMSYNGHLDFGILACTDSIPDVWNIASYLRDALAELVQ